MLLATVSVLNSARLDPEIWGTKEDTAVPIQR